MTISSDLQIYDVEKGKRVYLEPILEKSFEGWYLRHSKRTLREIEKVFAARLVEVEVGLVMLKNIDSHTGYVYYIAVSPEYRGMKIGGRLLDRSIAYFNDLGLDTIFASLTPEHSETMSLFRSHGFVQTSYRELSKRHGALHAVNLYRKMLVVSGETVVYKDLTRSLDETEDERSKSMTTDESSTN